MSNIDFQKLIDDFSTGKNHFKLKQGVGVILSVDANLYGAFSYIRANDQLPSTDSVWDKIQGWLSYADSQVGGVVAAVENTTVSEFLSVEHFRAFRARGPLVASEAMGEYLRSQNTQAVYVPKDVTHAVIKYSNEHDVRILETGLGKYFTWSKIEIYYGQDETRIGYCLTESFKDQPKFHNIISYNKLLAFENDLSTISKLIATTSDEPSVIGSGSEIIFDLSTASYTTIESVNVVNFFASDDDISNHFKESFLRAVERILSSLGMWEVQRSGRNSQAFPDAYYCFAKILSYSIDVRPNILPTITVTVPYRNVCAASKTKNVSQVVAEQAIGLVNSFETARQVSDKISNTEIFDFQKSFQNAEAILERATSAAPPIDYVADLAASLVGDPGTRAYVSQEEFSEIDERSVIIPLNIDDNDNLFGKTFSGARSILSKKEVELKKDLEGGKIRVSVRLSDYAESFGNFEIALRESLDSSEFLKKAKSEGSLAGFNGGSVNAPYYLYILFKSGYVTEIKIKDQSSIDVYVNEQLTSRDILPGIDEIIQNAPLTDETFSYLLTNINSLVDEKESLPLTDFMSKYITPADMAQITFISSEESDKKTTECLQSLKQQTKNNLKANTNEALNNILSGESKKNIQNTFAAAEWQDVRTRLSDIANTAGDACIDLKTLQWDAITEEVISCMKESESKDVVRFMLNAVKKNVIDDIPFACQIPSMPVPKFPLIKLPTLPNIPSMVTSYYKQFTDSLVSSRTDCITTIIKGIYELTDVCNKIDPAFLGQTSPPDLINGIDSEDEQLGQAEKALESNGIVSEATPYDEVKEILDATFKALAKRELITLLVGFPKDSTLEIAKSQINFLEYSGIIKKTPVALAGGNKKIYLDSSVSDLVDAKVIAFYAKFSNIINADAVEEAARSTNYSRDSDVLCQTSDINENTKRALMSKGLSEGQANKEVEKRVVDQQMAVVNLAISLDALDKSVSNMPPADCSVDADGNYTPGISDKIGSAPKSFDMLIKNSNKALYKSFNEAYNSDVKNFIQNAVYKDTVSDGPADSPFSIYHTEQIFLAKSMPMSISANPTNPGCFEPIYSLKNIDKTYYATRVNSSLYAKNDEKFRELIASSKDSAYSLLPLTINSVDNTMTYELLPASEGQNYSYTVKHFISSSFLGSTNDVLASTRQAEEDFINNSRLILEEKIKALAEIEKKYSDSTVNFDQKLIGDKSNLIGSEFTYVTNIKCTNPPTTVKQNVTLYSEDVIKRIAELDLVERYEKNKFSSFKIDESWFSKDRVSLVLDKNLNPIGTKKERSCPDYKDKRLIGAEEIINSAVSKKRNGCEPAKANLNGIREENQADKDSKDVVVRLLIKLYCVEYALSVSQLEEKVAYLSSLKWFTKVCYELFKKDITIKFGKSFFDKLSNRAKGDSQESEETIFADMFAKEFSDVAKRLNELTNSTTSYDTYHEYLIANSGIALYSSALSDTTTSEFIDMQERALFENKQLLISKDNNRLVLTFPKNSYDSITENGSRGQSSILEEIYTVFIPVDEVLANFATTLLTAVNSVGIIAGSFDSSKQDLKNVFDCIDSANDYTKVVKDSGITALASQLKVFKQIPEFIVKSLAETTDPNVMIATTISRAYSAGVVAAEMAGINVPVKRLPLFMISPFLFPPVMTPAGIAAVALSVKDLNIDFDTSVSNDDAGCPSGSL